MDYPYDLPTDGREAGIIMWQMQRETILAIRRMEELLLDHDQRLEALEGSTRKIAARTKDLRAMQKDHHIGLQQMHTAVHAPYYPEQSKKGKEKAGGMAGPSKPTAEFSFSQVQEDPSPEAKPSRLSFRELGESSREQSPVRAPRVPATPFTPGITVPALTPAAPGATPAPVPTPAAPAIPKLSSPDSYDGKKRGRPARQWLSRILAWIELSRAAFPDERSLILYMLHLLKDDAANWAEPHLSKILRRRTGALRTVEEFVEEFGRAFDDPDVGRAAERKIHDLTQDSLPTKSTAEYTTEFRNLISDLDWDDTAYLAAYRRGLNWKVRELMSQRENQPTTLESWITIATQIDNVRRENEASRPPRTTPNSKKVTVTSPATVTIKRDIKTSPNYVDETERKRRREAGLCIKCGATGHAIKDCKVGWKPAKVKEEKGQIAEEEAKSEDTESGKE
jgi:hypothetical protein